MKLHEREWKSRKALFFTVSILFILPALITMWTLSSYTVNIDKPLLLSRMYELSNSIEYSVKDMMDSYYDMEIVVENATNGTKDNVTLIENISTNQSEWSKNYIAAIGNFSNFVEAQEPAITMNLTNLQDKQGPVILMPHNLTYARKWSAGNVSIKVTPQFLTFNSYDVFVNSSVKIANVSYKIGTAGTFSFSVLAVDNASFRNATKFSVDPSSTHQINVTFTNNNRVSVNLAGNVLHTWTNSPAPVVIATKIDSLDDQGEKVTAHVFNQPVNISFPSLNAEQLTSIEFTESQ